MPETTLKKAKRSQFMSFLNTTPAETSATWSRFGKGVTSQSVAYNAQTTTETYIDADTADTSVDSYQPSINTPQTVYAGEPIFDFVDSLRQKAAVGDDARTQVLLVNAYVAGTAGSYPAQKYDATLEVTDFGGEGGKPLSITYNVHLCGDPVQGTFAVGTATFTEAGAA